MPRAQGWVFLLPTVTKEDAEKYFPDHKVCVGPKGEDSVGPVCACVHMRVCVCECPTRAFACAQLTCEHARQAPGLRLHVLAYLMLHADVRRAQWQGVPAPHDH
jgi:hypothetical protein